MPAIVLAALEATALTAGAVAALVVSVVTILEAIDHLKKVIRKM